jgi:coatomer subunit beta
MLYWELVPKYGPDGKLLSEMILVCNALRNDLTSPNEYIRGSMLRFLCKLKEPELLEPLIPSIKAALEHRHSYVRRNAALAVFSIHKNFGEQLLPDGPELMEKFIMEESDVSARRNAFLMLFNEAEGIAIDFLSDHIDDISRFGDGFALLVLELTRKTCRRDPAQKSRFVKCLFLLLRSESAAVCYEAAWTLVSLSSAPTAVRACGQTYAQLLAKSSDNNVKLIVLDRLAELKKHHHKVVQENLMDILRALSSPNIDISKKVLSIAIDMVGPRNIEEVMQTLKREVVRAQGTDMENGEEYKTSLIQAIHKCALKYAEVADSIVLVLLDFLNGDSGYTVMQCVKSILEQYPDFRSSIMRKIIDNFDEISTSEALRVGLWIISEYAEVVDPSTGQPMIEDGFAAIKDSIGPAPYVTKIDTATATVGADAAANVTQYVTKNIVLEDGTYATVTEAVASGGAGAAGEKEDSHMRKLVIDGDVMLGTVAAVSCTKIVLKSNFNNLSIVEGTLRLVAGVGKLTESKKADRVGVYADSLERLAQCARVLLDPSVRKVMTPIFLESCRGAFTDLVNEAKSTKAKAADAAKQLTVSQADDLIQFRQLRAAAVQGGIELDLMDADDISRAVGSEASTGTTTKHVYQLTGYSDPVYAEASVTVHDYDIMLDILVINRTQSTLTNLAVELATMGDLKLVERPQSHTIGPMDSRRLRANIKVSSTETGHIFGTIVFDNSSSAQKTYVNLNDIQLDIMDYIRPADCKNETFRSMWAEFEWENKVAINTNITDLRDFLSHIVKNTNMQCLTPLGENNSSLIGSNFLAANLYARSVFGEDALVNLSVEKKEGADGKLNGYIRIRSKTQGIALSLGDRITTVLRATPEATPEADAQ